MYERFFQIDRIKYRFVVNSDFSVVFVLHGVFTKGGVPLPAINVWGDVLH
jgi:hypothetical protein